MTDHEQPAAEVALKVKEIVSRACWDYASGLNTGPVRTRPDRRDAAIRDGVQEVLGLIQAPTNAGGAVSEADVYDRIHTFMFDRDQAIAGDPHSPEELDESVREIMRLAALTPAPQALQQGGEVTREAGVERVLKHLDYLAPARDMTVDNVNVGDTAKRAARALRSLAADRDKAVGFLVEHGKEKTARQWDEFEERIFAFLSRQKDQPHD